MLTKWLSILAVIVVCALTVVGCHSTTGRSFGQQVDDKTITSHVKTKLTTDKFVHLFSTDVGTHYGVVHLGGNVATPAERAEAERIASRVKGVKRVVNDIVVVPRDSKAAGTPGSSPASTSSIGPTR